jgi:indole-3-glycerol phosphate synthase
MTKFTVQKNMNILDKIVAHKKLQVAERRNTVPMAQLEKGEVFHRKTVSLMKHLTHPASSGIIAEFKRKSPSKGIINPDAEVVTTTRGYVAAGAAALSVLTDEEFFGGSSENLQKARQHNACPILRKDFMIDEYQIVEAKALGADVILLIAAILTPDEMKNLAMVARSLEMEVLLEVHNEAELRQSALNEMVAPYINVVGVNNRNLKTFEVSVDTSKELAVLIPDNFVKISESGISNPVTILQLQEYGYRGFLIGENFMKTDDPTKACEDFIRLLRNQKIQTKN